MGIILAVPGGPDRESTYLVAVLSGEYLYSAPAATLRAW
jgi:hypothetical protein